jgi:hypothetical protein
MQTMHLATDRVGLGGGDVGRGDGAGEGALLGAGGDAEGGGGAEEPTKFSKSDLVETGNKNGEDGFGPPLEDASGAGAPGLEVAGVSVGGGGKGATGVRSISGTASGGWGGAGSGSGGGTIGSCLGAPTGALHAAEGAEGGGGGEVAATGPTVIGGGSSEGPRRSWSGVEGTTGAERVSGAG